MKVQINRLPRVLGPWMAGAIVVGTVIGSGVFKKGQNVAERVPETGPALLVWVFGGLLALFGSLALAEICVLFPRAGGNFTFLREGFGRFTGFLWGWIDLGIIRSCSIAALASMFAEGLADVLKQLNAGEPMLHFWPQQILACFVIAALGHLNAEGTRLGARFQVFLTVLKVTSIVAIIILPILIIFTVTLPEYPPQLGKLRPVWPADWTAFDTGKYLAAMVAVLWAYHGWMNVGPVAEEVRNPGRNIPLSLLGGVLALIALYVGANFAYLTVIPSSEMAGLKNTAVSTEFGLRLLGPAGAVIASGILMLSVFGSLNGNLLVGPRTLFAMARERMVPESLASLRPRTQTPTLATAALSAWSIGIVLGGAALTQYRFPNLTFAGTTIDFNLPAGKPLFDVLTDLAVFGVVGFESLVIAALFRFRQRYPVKEVKLPYRCPGFPVVPAIYLIAMTGVFLNMFASEDLRGGAVFGASFLAVGALIYRLFVAKSGPASVPPFAETGERD